MYVIVEGIDGSGKSSVVTALAEQLGDKGWPPFQPAPFKQRVLVRREPSGSDAGRAARAYFKGRSTGAPYDPLVAAGLMIADRQAALHARYGLVCSDDSLLLSDRGFLSTLAYQGPDAARKYEKPMLELLWDMHGFLPLPHVVLYLDCPPELAFSRARIRGEHLTFQEVKDVYRGYDEALAWMLTDPSRRAPTIFRIPVGPDQSLAEVVSACRQDLLAFIARGPHPIRAMN